MKTNENVLKEALGNALAEHEENLITIPGIGIILAAKIVAHSDYLERFATIDKLLQYSGIALLEKRSEKIKKAVQNNKGNRHLNSTMYMVPEPKIERLLSKGTGRRKNQRTHTALCDEADYHDNL